MKSEEPTSLDSLELRMRQEKHALECRKIEADILEAKRPLWQRPAFYGAIMPVAIAFAGIYFSWSTGWFDSQQKKLDAQRIALEIDVRNLEGRKTQIELTLRGLTNAGEVLSNEVKVLSADKAKLSLEKQRQEDALRLFEAKVANLGSDKTNLIAELRSFQQQVVKLSTDKTALAAEHDALRKLYDKDRSFLTNALEGLNKEYQDLQDLRAQIGKLREEVSIARRLESIRRGLYGGPPPTNGSARPVTNRVVESLPRK